MKPDPRAAARRLAAAWTSRTLLDALPEGERPATLDEAYDIQQALQRELGERSAGWKIGGASVRGLQSSPSGKALFGFLRESCVHASGAVLPLPQPGAVTLEVEIAVRFARDAAPASEPFDPSLVDAAFVAIEVVRSRFRDRKAVGQPSFVADDAGFHAFIRGDEFPAALRSPELAEPAFLHRDDAPVAEPMAGEEGIDASVALQLFWAHAAARGVRVPAGAIVTTGTQTRPVDVGRPGTYEGGIGGRTVRVTFR